MARQLDNFALLLAPPFDKRVISSGNGGDEYRRGVNLPDTEIVRVPLDDMKHAVPKFDFGRSLDKHLRVHKSPHNVWPFRSGLSERFEIGPHLRGLIHPVTSMVSA